VVRRTFDSQTVAANAISITLPENEQFQAITNTAYSFTVMGSTSSAYPAGAQIPIDTVNTGAIGYTTFTSADRTTIQITNLDVTGDSGAITSVKVTAS